MFYKSLIGFVGALAFSTSVFAVNVNSASATELADGLHGIGMKKAEAILTYCHENTCAKPEDLLHVKGIGEKTLEKIKDDLEF